MQRLTEKFTKFKEGTFVFNPKDEHVGSYTIQLRVIDKKTGKQSKPVNFKIKVESYITSKDSPRCPLQTGCLPWIVDVSNVGIAVIKFPYELRQDSQNISHEEYMKNMTADISFIIMPNAKNDLDVIESPKQSKLPRVNNWTVIYASKDTIKVQLNFTNPLELS